jgi:hypothetical protein
MLAAHSARFAKIYSAGASLSTAWSRLSRNFKLAGSGFPGPDFFTASDIADPSEERFVRSAV